MDFKGFISNLFLSKDVEVVDETIIEAAPEATIEEVKEVVEEVVEIVASEVEKAYITDEEMKAMGYITEDTLKEVVATTVAETLVSIQLSKDSTMEAVEGLKEVVTALQLELNKPAGDAAVVVPEVKKAAAQKAFNMQKEVEKGL